MLQTLFLCFSSLLFSVFVDAAAGRALALADEALPRNAKRQTVKSGGHS